MSTTTPFAVIVDNACFQTKGVNCRLVETRAKWTREPVNKTARDQTPEPKQHVETRHVEKNGKQCFKSGRKRQSQSEAENFRDEDETDQSKIETVWFG